MFDDAFADVVVNEESGWRVRNSSIILERI